MNFKAIVKTTGAALQKASPTIMLVGGIAGGVAATVLACKATLRVDEVLENSKKKVQTIHAVAENKEQYPEYTDNDKTRDLAVTYVQTAWGLTKLYSPALIVGGLSILSIIGGHKIMAKRVAALGASCALLSESLKRYRANVAERYGDEAERDIYTGQSSEKVEEMRVMDDGKEKKVKVDVKVVDENKIVSPFVVIFDESNPNYIKGDPVANYDFLVQIEKYLNDKLERQGWLSHNDARANFGFKPIPEGQANVWINDHDDPACACYIDTGITHELRQDVLDFRSGKTDRFVLDLTPDGVMVDKIPLFDKSNRA